TGHRHDLTGIGRIGEHFLVPGHARVEHDFARGFALRAGRGAAEPGAVFERENGFHGHTLHTETTEHTETTDLCALSGLCVNRLHFSNEAVTRFRSPATTRTDDDQVRKSVV